MIFDLELLSILIIIRDKGLKPNLKGITLIRDRDGFEVEPEGKSDDGSCPSRKSRACRTSPPAKSRGVDRGWAAGNGGEGNRRGDHAGNRRPRRSWGRNGLQLFQIKRGTCNRRPRTADLFARPQDREGHQPFRRSRPSLCIWNPHGDRHGDGRRPLAATPEPIGSHRRRDVPADGPIRDPRYGERYQGRTFQGG